jgi:uncharacterized protein YkwD
MRIRMLFAAAATTLAVTLAQPAAAAQAGPRKQMVRTINYVRSWSNRHPLRFSQRLSRGAASWARSLMRRNQFAHSNRAVQSGLGEIIEWHTGAGANVNSTVMEWWHSTGHRNIMLGHYRRAGAGRAVGYFGGQRCTIWVVRFAR